MSKYFCMRAGDAGKDDGGGDGGHVEHVLKEMHDRSFCKNQSECTGLFPVANEHQYLLNRGMSRECTLYVLWNKAREVGYPTGRYGTLGRGRERKLVCSQVGVMCTSHLTGEARPTFPSRASQLFTDQVSIRGWESVSNTVTVIE